MELRIKLWVIIAVALVTVALGVAIGVAATSTAAPKPWNLRHGVVIQKAADNYLMNNSCPLKTTSLDTISASELKILISPDDPAGASNDPLIIDIRKKEEYSVGTVPGAIWIDNFGYMAKPHNLSKLDAALDAHYKATGNSDIVIVCHSGIKGALVTAAYGMLGHNVKDLVGGYGAWASLK